MYLIFRKKDIQQTLEEQKLDTLINDVPIHSQTQTQTCRIGPETSSILHFSQNQPQHIFSELTIRSRIVQRVQKHNIYQKDQKSMQTHTHTIRNKLACTISKT